MGQLGREDTCRSRKSQTLENVPLAGGQSVDVDDVAVWPALDANRVALEGPQDRFGGGALLGDGGVQLDPLPVASLDEVVTHQGDEQEVDECFHPPGILQEDRMDGQRQLLHQTMTKLDRELPPLRIPSDILLPEPPPPLKLIVGAEV